MSSDTRTFHIGDIISVTDGRLVSPRHVEGVYDILGWMTGESLMTHQLPRAVRECEDNLRAQHPDIAAIEVPDWSKVPRDEIEATVMTWLIQQSDNHGGTRPVARLAREDHTQIDPLDELRMIRPDAQIITIKPDADR